MEPMRCLSIRQPWAWQVCATVKCVENRTWTTDYRGTIAIHAGSSKQHLNAWLREVNDTAFSLAMFPTGAIIGVADIVNVTELSPELETDAAASGPICWTFANGRLLPKPITHKGKLNLFFLSDDITAGIQSQLAEAKSANPVVVQKAIAAGQSSFARLQRQVWRAESYAQLDRPHDAIRCLTTAVEFDGQSGIAYRMRGANYLAINEPEKAMQDCDRAIALDSEDAVAYWVRAEVNRALGNGAQATADDRRAYEIDPTLSEQDDSAGADVESAAE